MSEIEMVADKIETLEVVGKVVVLRLKHLNASLLAGGPSVHLRLESALNFHKKVFLKAGALDVVLSDYDEAQFQNLTDEDLKAMGLQRISKG